jgi:hypothetical protein
MFFGYYLKEFGCCPIRFSLPIDSGLIFTIDLSTEKKINCHFVVTNLNFKILITKSNDQKFGNQKYNCLMDNGSISSID